LLSPNGICNRGPRSTPCPFRRALRYRRIRDDGPGGPGELRVVPRRLLGHDCGQQGRGPPAAGGAGRASTPQAAGSRWRRAGQHPPGRRQQVAPSAPGERQPTKAPIRRIPRASHAAAGRTRKSLQSADPAKASRAMMMSAWPGMGKGDLAGPPTDCSVSPLGLISHSPLKPVARSPCCIHNNKTV